MKSIVKAFVVFTLVVGLSACGGKGGVKNSGVEANGDCSAQALSDYQTTAANMKKELDEAQKMAGRRDAAATKAKLKDGYNAGMEFVTKYGKNFSCKKPNSDEMISAAFRAAVCDTLKKSANL